MKHLKYILIIAAFSGIFVSCEKFLDINDDPNNPTSATIVNLMPTAQVSVGYAFSNFPQA